MNVYENIKDWLSQCPDVDSYIYFNVIPIEPETTAITTMPSERVIMEFIDGSKEKEVLFNINLIKQYDDGGTSDINVLAIKAFESITRWVEEQNLKQNYPEFDDNIFVESIECSYTTPDVYVSPEQGVCRYESQYKLTYLEKRSAK